MDENKRLILVFYIDVSRIYEGDVPEYMNDVATSLSKNDDGTDKYFIPIYEGGSRLECINPVMVSEEEYADVKRKLDEIDKKYRQLTLEPDTRDKKRKKVIKAATSSPKKARKLLEDSGIIDIDGNIAEVYNNVK